MIVYDIVNVDRYDAFTISYHQCSICEISGAGAEFRGGRLRRLRLTIPAALLEKMYSQGRDFVQSGLNPGV